LEKEESICAKRYSVERKKKNDKHSLLDKALSFLAACIFILASKYYTNIKVSNNSIKIASLLILLIVWG
jgi:hypothetical protein